MEDRPAGRVKETPAIEPVTRRDMVSPCPTKEELAGRPVKEPLLVSPRPKAVNDAFIDKVEDTGEAK
jgi:hypothetical protein